MSQATFVVVSDLERGGTWGGATEALRRNIAPILVWMGAGAGAGNEKLVEPGATPIDSIDQLLDSKDPRLTRESVPDRRRTTAALATRLRRGFMGA